MKKLVFMAVSLLITAGALYAKPNEKLEKLFDKTFPEARNVKWYHDADGYVVGFTQAGIVNKISYDNDDNFVSSLRYYDEKNLPANILFAVKKRFTGKTIFGVTELTNTDEVSYYVRVKDDKEWCTVKATTDGALRITERYKLQPEN